MDALGGGRGGADGFRDEENAAQTAGGEEGAGRGEATVARTAGREHGAGRGEDEAGGEDQLQEQFLISNP